MSTWNPRANDLFLLAMELRTADERRSLLDRECGADAALRVEVECLLEASDRAGSFLDRPAEDPDVTQGADPASGGETTVLLPSESVGAVIGPYKLLQQIGEGGMGAVFMAEQERPVRRKVALKVIKAGMDSGQVVARFEAERQALAMMDHVNIARVLDAGATGTGRPYFVMELVHGVPITQYCDDNQLTPRQRLELFVPVCQAIQHAHQKGIIHRDIKPSNVLVTLYDGRPVPKVIDFGVAKATEQKLTDRTLFTQYGTLVGTLEYMSPEQAEMSALGVDTRSDIYSLGVLMYELLTGSTPLSHDRVRGAAFAEILRLIKEEEPPRPSNRLSGSGEALASISARRHMEPEGLTKLVRGELDWIAMKCLEKDRNRRYETANAFAVDIQRHLNDEPVSACPPSAVYRMRKFARRYRAGLAVGAVVTLTLLVALSGVVGAVGWALRDREANAQRIARETTSRQARLDQQIVRALGDIQSSYRSGQLPEAMASARQAQGLIASGGASPTLRERARQWRTDLEMVARLERIRLEQSGQSDDGKIDWSGADRAYQAAFDGYGLDLAALDAAQASRMIRSGAITIDICVAIDNWADVRRRLPEVDEQSWRRLVTVAIAADPDPLRSRLRELWGREAAEVRDQIQQLATPRPGQVLHPSTIVLLASVFEKAQLNSQAESVLREGQARNPGDFWVNMKLAYALIAYPPQRPAEAASFYRAALAVRPNAALILASLGYTLEAQGLMDEAERAHLEAIRLAPKYAHPRNGLGRLRRDQRRWPEAITAFEDAVRLDPNFVQPYGELARILANCPEPKFRDAGRAVQMAEKGVEISPSWVWGWQNLGHAQYRSGNWRASIEAMETSCGLQGNPEKGDSYQWYFLAMAHRQLGDLEEARRWYDKSVAWTEQHGQQNSEELSFLSEAADVLQVSPPAWFSLGLARDYVSREQWDDAADEYVRELEQSSEAADPSGSALVRQELAQHDEIFERVVARRPDDLLLWIDRGRYLAHHHRWSEARAAYDGVIDDVPMGLACVEYACLLLLDDDMEGHRAYCERLSGRLPEDEGPYPVFLMARAAAMAPGGSVDPETIVAWAQKAVNDGPPPAWFVHALGLAELRAGRPELAISRAEQSNGLKWREACKGQNWLLLALAQHAMGHAEPAIGSLREGLTRLDDAADLSAVDRLEIEVLLRQLPDTPEFWLERGRYHVRRNRWEDARACYARMADPPPWEYGCALLLSGDIDGYRRLCRDLSASWGESDPMGVSPLLPATCALSPESGVDPSALLRVAEQAAARHRNTLSLSALAASEYRSGRYERAIEHLMEAIELQDSPRNEFAPLLALAHQGLGQEVEARAWFDLADLDLQSARPEDPDSAWPWEPGPWAGVLVWHQEAAETLGVTQQLAQLDTRSEAELRVQARQHVRLSQWDQAAVAYARLLDSLPMELGTGSPRKSVCQEVAQNDEIFRRLLKIRPQDPQLWIARGRQHLRYNRIDEAASAYGRVIDHHPIDDEHFEYACILAILGKQAELESFLRRTAGRQTDIIGAFEQYVLTRAAAVVPQDALTSDVVVNWGGDAVAQEGRAWFRHALALAHYRDGAFEAALDQSRQSDAGDWYPAGRAVSTLTRALAHHRLGLAEEARLELAEAHAIFDPLLTPDPSMLVTERLEARLLFDEAEALINPDRDSATQAQRSESVP